MIHLMDLSDSGELEGYRKWSDGRERIEDVSQYVWDWLQLDPTATIMFGIDSQVQGRNTNYVVAVVFYSKIIRRGGHVIYKKIQHPKFGPNKDSIIEKLSLEASIVFEEIKPFVRELRDRGFDQWDRLNIHVDFNSNEGTGSNTAYKSHVGWLSSMGLEVHVKPQSYAAMAADKILKPTGTRGKAIKRLIRKDRRKKKRGKRSK